MGQQKDWCSRMSTQMNTSYYLGQSSYLGRNTYSPFHGFWQSFVTIGSCNHLVRIISTYVGNTKKSEISWRWQLFKLDNQLWGVKRTSSYFLLVAIIKPFIRHLKDCYFFSLKFFKNFDYRYCLLTTWIKHRLNKVKAFEPVPFSADRIQSCVHTSQQQFYLCQLP